MCIIEIEEMEKAKDEPGPFERKVYEDDDIEIYLYEPDRGKKYAGPAAFNRIYVKDGNVFSTLNEVEGVFISRYADLIALRFARMIEEGKSGQEAIVQAAQKRFRPILLTTMTTIAGLLPLALSHTTLWPPLAWAMISGLLVSTVLTLLVTPALYKLALTPAHSTEREKT